MSDAQPNSLNLLDCGAIFSHSAAFISSIQQEENMSEKQDKAKAAQPEELESAKELLQRYAMPAIIGVGLALVALIAVNYITTKKTTNAMDASSMLATASGPGDLEAIIKDYPNTATAPLAMLHLASVRYNDKDYVLAAETYVSFQEAYPEHAFAPAAALGQIHCDEAQGKLDAALTGYSQFNTEHADHFLRTQAVMGEGRTLEQLGRYEDAKSVYEDYIASTPDAQGIDQIESVLEKVTLVIATPALAEFSKLATPAETFTPAAPQNANDFLSGLLPQASVSPDVAPAVVEPAVAEPAVVAPAVVAPAVVAPAVVEPAVVEPAKVEAAVIEEATEAAKPVAESPTPAE
ncbi:MAG: putative negative regulator of RcsB-dependent stress response [Kiritimatiellia bacterium]